MPLYEYKTTEDGCDHCRDGFEVFQGMKDAPLTECPECGGPVKKAVSAFGLGQEDVMGESNLKKHGFSKYKKTCDGTYEKQV